MKGIIRCDASDVVGGIVAFVLSQRLSLRLIHDALTRASNTVVADAVMIGNGLRCFANVRLEGSGRGVLTVAQQPNEWRAISTLQRLTPELSWTELHLDFGARQIASVFRGAAFAISRWPRLARIRRRVQARHDAFRASRVMELIWYYLRFSELLKQQRFTAVVISSHSNPHGIALNVAAKRLGLPVILITHGMPIVPIARLDYDLAIMECEASTALYLQAKCGMGRTIVKSRQSDLVKMELGHLRNVGIFLSKDPIDTRFIELAKALLADRRVNRILVRPHPVNLWGDLRACLGSFGDERITLTCSPTLVDDVRACDLVLASNSSVHIDALLAGRPTCYVRGLDHAPFDVQSFVRDGLVYHLQDIARLDWDEIRQFYGRSEWSTALRRYADIDRGHADVAKEIRAAFLPLATPAPGT